MWSPGRDLDPATTSRISVPSSLRGSQLRPEPDTACEAQPRRLGAVLLLERKWDGSILRHHRLELCERGVGIVVEILLLLALGGQPVAEPARRGPLAPCLLFGRAHGEVVGVLVLRMPLVAPHPRPLRVVETQRAMQLLPELQ